MKLFLVLFACITLGTLSAQTNIQYRKSAWGLHFAPSLSYRSLNFEKNQQHVEAARDKAERPAFSYSVGLYYQRKTHNNNAIETSISFASLEYQTGKTSLSWETPGPALPTEVRTKYQYQYLQLSAGYRYRLFGRESNIFIIPSMYGAALIQQKTIVNTDGNQQSNRTVSTSRGGYRDVDLGFQLGAGMEFTVSRRIRVSLEPFYKRSVSSLLAVGKNREFLYQAGLQTKVYLLRIRK